MAKIQGKNIKLKDGQRIYLGTNDDSSIWYDGSELRISTVVSGVDPTADGHLVTKKYVDSKASNVDWQDSVIDNTLSTPPGSPSTGDRYLIASGATGAWAGHDGDIAEWDGSSWVFTIKNSGMAVYVENANKVYIYNGTNWVVMASIFSHSNLADLNADDHTQYIRVDGARGFTATVSGVDPVAPSDLATKNYVDTTISSSKRYGRESLPLNASSVSVTFSTPFSDTNYTVSTILTNTIDSTPSIYPMMVSAKATTGFTVIFSGDMDSANYVLEWMAIHD